LGARKDALGIGAGGVVELADLQGTVTVVTERFCFACGLLRIRDPLHVHRVQQLDPAFGGRAFVRVRRKNGSQPDQAGHDSHAGKNPRSMHNAFYHGAPVSLTVPPFVPPLVEGRAPSTALPAPYPPNNPRR
jgi:hypothetical protein